MSAKRMRSEFVRDDQPWFFIMIADGDDEPMGCTFVRALSPGGAFAVARMLGLLEGGCNANIKGPIPVEAMDGFVPPEHREVRLGVEHVARYEAGPPQ